MSVRELLRPGKIRRSTWQPSPTVTHVDCLVVMAVGKGMADEAIDTLDSIYAHFAGVTMAVVVVDDCTHDGTLARLQAYQGAGYKVISNLVPRGKRLLSQSLADAYAFALDRWQFDVALRMDVDALVTGDGLLGDAASYVRQNPTVGMFGMYHLNVDGSPTSYRAHTQMFRTQSERFGRAWYQSVLAQAQQNGWGLGQSVFGGACFFTYDCLVGLRRSGALAVPDHTWAYTVSEDVYFSMAVVAAGFDLGHFAAPSGPLAMGHEDLPLSPEEIVAGDYKLVHSVDKGRFASTARPFFAARRAVVQ